MTGDVTGVDVARVRGLYPTLARDVLGGPDRDLPVAAFSVDDVLPDEVGAHLHRRDISVWTGPSGLTQLLRTFGADELGGAAFAGVMPHTTRGEIAQFLDAVRELKR